MDRSAPLSVAAAASSCVAWLRRRRRLDPSRLLAAAGVPPRPVKVNLGSSLVVAPGWINVDGSSVLLLRRLPVPVLRRLSRLSAAAGDPDTFVEVLRGNVFVHHDLRHGVPFVEGCADVILAAHFLEHLSRSDALRLLHESLSVLRPGGLIRISVPDATPALNAIREGRDRDGLEALFADTQHREADYHHYAYDEALLREALEEAGFEQIRRCPPGEGEVPDLEVLDGRPEGSVFMEARRPSS